MGGLFEPAELQAAMAAAAGPQLPPPGGGGGGGVVEIPFHVHRDKPPKWVSGIDDRTSCSDILMSLAGAVRNSDGEAVFRYEQYTTFFRLIILKFAGNFRKTQGKTEKSANLRQLLS